MTNKFTRITELCESWQELKSLEQKYQVERRDIEDRILREIALDPSFEGTKEIGDLTLTARMTRKVDAKKVDEIAKENGTESHLSALFRWTAAINTAVWKATDGSITDPLKAAITTTPGRPSFKLTTKKKD